MTRILIAALAATAATAAMAHGANHAQLPGAVKARHGQMQIQSFNLGIVGGMARGDADYDAETAQAAADSLVATSAIAPDPMWRDAEGTSSEEVEGSRALPAVWSDYEGFLEKLRAYDEAALALQAVAGDGLDALRPAVGAVGQSCGGCHDDYRVSN